VTPPNDPTIDPPPAYPPTTPPPATPIPPPASPYGDPTPPAAPDTPPPAPVPPAAQPSGQPYGQPYSQPYGQPAQPYPQPGTSPVPEQPYGAPAPEQAGKGTAIAALIVSFLGCTCVGAIVSIILSIVVLRRGRDGRNHGKGLAIAAIIVSVLSLLAGLAIAGLIAYAASLEGIDDLKSGQCFNADGINDGSTKGVTNVNTVSCSSSHDAEVLTVGHLTKEQAQSFDSTACDQSLADAGKTDLIKPPLTYNGLTGSNPNAGDKFVCIAYNADGSKLTAKVG
jgi:hypothetical protein